MKKEIKKELKKDLLNPMTKKYINDSKYLNRELSWLEFNKRVLAQTVRKEVPLLERCNFLSITSSNIDEFIMVRLSSILNKIQKGNSEPDISGMNPFKEFDAVMKGIHDFKKMQNVCFSNLVSKLEKRGVYLCKYKELDKDEKSYIGKIFYQKIYPLLTPINFDTTKEFPEIDSKQQCVVVSLEDSQNTNLRVMSFIPLDDNLDRIYKVSTKKGITKYILLEELIYGYLKTIYYNKRIIDYGMIKILREADIELSNNQDVYIVDRMRATILKRKHSRPIFMDITDVSNNLQKILSKMFELKNRHVFVNEQSFNYKGLTEIYLDNASYEKFEPQYPSELIGEHDIFSAIDNGEILLHHPYESYDPVVKFLEHSAYDKNVVSIRQTLYRVSSADSPIVDALCKAAQNGKQVSVILEIKARFDEDRNISLIDKLRNSGVTLIYGVEELKTHCKFITVVRKAKDGFKIYSHMGTGNYNDKTAKLYTDISYFTSSYKVGQDLITIFNMLSGFSEPTTKINRIYFSPYNLRKRITQMIDNEIKNAKNGKTAIVTLKVNSISDKEMIDKLYQASKAGVKIMIFCRGICSMKPINRNIVIKSIVGRYLEHSRIYYFHNNKNPNVYISSADLLTRNLDKRFELLIPVKNADTKEKLIKILSMYYRDEYNTFQMNNDGSYVKLKGDVDIHDLFMKEAIDNYKFKSVPKLFKKK